MNIFSKLFMISNENGKVDFSEFLALTSEISFSKEGFKKLQEQDFDIDEQGFVFVDELEDFLAKNMVDFL